MKTIVFYAAFCVLSFLVIFFLGEEGLHIEYPQGHSQEIKGVCNLDELPKVKQ